MTDGGNAENLGSSAHHCCARTVCTAMVFSVFPIPSPTARTLFFNICCLRIRHTAYVKGQSPVVGSRWHGGPRKINERDRPRLATAPPCCPNWHLHESSSR